MKSKLILALSFVALLTACGEHADDGVGANIVNPLTPTAAQLVADKAIVSDSRSYFILNPNAASEEVHKRFKGLRLLRNEVTTGTSTIKQMLVTAVAVEYKNNLCPTVTYQSGIFHETIARNQFVPIHNLGRITCLDDEIARDENRTLDAADKCDYILLYIEQAITVDGQKTVSSVPLVMQKENGGKYYYPTNTRGRYSSYYLRTDTPDAMSSHMCKNAIAVLPYIGGSSVAWGSGPR